MKKKEKQTVSAMTRDELVKILKDAQSALDIYVIGRYSKQSKNTREGRLLKRKIAILSTLMRQKELIHE